MTDPVEYPFTPSPLPPVSIAGGNKMVYLWMTDYVANTASAVYQKAGILSFTISDDMHGVIICTKNSKREMGEYRGRGKEREGWKEERGEGKRRGGV